MEALSAKRLGAAALEAAGSKEVRAFFGLPLPDAQRGVLDRYLAACATAARGFRWTPAANLHLTVRFVGRVDEALVLGVADRLAGQAWADFELSLGDSGTFKGGRFVRVVWLALASGAEALAQLAAKVDAECIAAGLPGETRPFTAHLTLARALARDGDVLPSLPPPPRMGAWRARDLVLYSSRLTRTGSVYEPLRTIALQ
jgi:2'-5' RNA ligase